jgi:hypothetical protein
MIEQILQSKTASFPLVAVNQTVSLTDLVRVLAGAFLMVYIRVKVTSKFLKFTKFR